MHIKVNGLQAITASITRPLTGRWSAEFTLDSHETIDLGTTAIILLGDYMEFVGTVSRSGEANGRSEIRVVGGNNGIENEIPGKSYHKPTFGIVLKDILLEAGETISSEIAADVMSYQLPHWCRANNPARRELVLLLQLRGLNWRILPNGDVWVGFDDWPDGIIGEYLIEESDNKSGRAVIASEVPTISPGEVFVDRFVQTVVHMLDKAKLRTELVFID